MDDLTLPLLHGTSAEWAVGRLWRSKIEPTQPALGHEPLELRIRDWPVSGLVTRVLISTQPRLLLEAWHRGGALLKGMLGARFSFEKFLSGKELDSESSAWLADADKRGTTETDRELRHSHWYAASLASADGPFDSGSFTAAATMIHSEIDWAGRVALAAFDLAPAELVAPELRIVRPEGREQWVGLPRVSCGNPDLRVFNSEHEAQRRRTWAARGREITVTRIEGARDSMRGPDDQASSRYELVRNRVDRQAKDAEPLATCAYWVLTCLEKWAGTRREAAECFRVASPVLEALGKLSTSADRKAREMPITAVQQRWLGAVLGAIVAQLGEMAITGAAPQSQVTMVQLPALEDES